MKSLPIDEKFTKDYVSELSSFCSYLISSTSSGYNNSFHQSILQLKENLKVASRQLSKNSERYEQEISIKSFSVPYVNRKAGEYRNNFSLLIGGCIKFNQGILVSQSISFSVVYEVYENIDSESADILRTHNYEVGSHVIRKFHFDIDRSVEEERPLSHLQYGGSFKEEHYKDCTNISDLEYQLFAAMDDPRLPNVPYGFITCIDIIFRSFNSKFSAITKERAWINHVSESEQKWLVPFFKSALANLENTGNETFYQFMSKKS